MQIYTLAKKSFAVLKLRLTLSKTSDNRKTICHLNLVGRPNQDLCIIKGENLCVTGPYETVCNYP